MKIKPIIEGQCVIVPSAPVMCRLSEAGGTRLKVLLYILATPDFDPEEAADALNITVKSFNAAIEYWVKAGANSIIGRENINAYIITIVCMLQFWRAAGF